MSHIVLNEEQLGILNRARGGAIEVRSPDGNSLGFLEFISEADIINECKRRQAANEPTFSTSQVLAHFQALEEASKAGASEQQLWELLKKMQNESQS